MKRWLFAAALLLGCATTRGEARDAGAAAVGCPESAVRVTSLGAAQYVVEGCGHSVEVDCQDPRTVAEGTSRAACRAGHVR